MIVGGSFFFGSHLTIICESFVIERVVDLSSSHVHSCPSGVMLVGDVPPRGVGCSEFVDWAMEVFCWLSSLLLLRLY